MRAFSALLALAILLLCCATAHAQCHVRPGDHIVLYGTTDDPDVFIWDSRFRLRDYEGGSFDQMNALLPHAVLARPGTRAVVEACVDNFVQSKYFTTPDSAIGVRIVGGPLNGQRGWVLGASIRALNKQRPNH
jgi:hypothetical protein